MHDDMEEALLSPSYATEADRNALMFTEDFQELMENTSQQTLHSRNKNIFNSSYQKNNHEISTIASIQESNKPVLNLQFARMAILTNFRTQAFFWLRIRRTKDASNCGTLIHRRLK